MRQAGRSLPEYRARRGTGDILGAIREPELAAELTLQPVRRYGVDAAVLFSDIVVPLAAIGAGVEVVPGRGPVVGQPFASTRDLGRLRRFEPPTDAPYVAATIGLVTKELDVPLIGFAGAPFTLASYLIEGGPSKTFARTKSLMHEAPELWTGLMDRLVSITVASLVDQIEAGVSAIQLFDSWAGALSPTDYAQFALPATAAVLDGLHEAGVPRILFGVGTGELLELMASAPVEVIGVDWRVPLARAFARVGDNRAVQGNLDPALCLSSTSLALAETRRILNEAAGHDGYIFNLGHGVLPETDPGVLAEVVALVHAEGRRDRRGQRRTVQHSDREVGGDRDSTGRSGQGSARGQGS